MPIPSRSRLRLIPALALVALSLGAGETSAQTLARPGWVGSGMAAQSWFRHAVFYEIDTRSFARGSKETAGSAGTLSGITERLDYIKDLGVDAILLEPLTPTGTAAHPAPVDPALGTIDDFDELSRQASRHNLRIVLTLAQPDAALARFWLTRGVAGFYIPGQADAAALQAIRKLLPGTAGQRILITDTDLAGSPARTAVKMASRLPANELHLDRAVLGLPSPPPANLAAGLRGALEQTQSLSRALPTLLATDAPALPRSADRFALPDHDHQADAAKLAGAVLLLNRSIPVIFAGQELGLSSPSGAPVMIPWGKDPTRSPETAAEAAPPTPPQPTANNTPSDRYVPYVPPARPVKPPPPDPATAAGQELDPNSVLSFYRQLIEIHRGRIDVHDGDEVLLNHDNVNALLWVHRPAKPSLATPALVVLCNPSPNPLELSIKPDMTSLHLRGSFLRRVLSSEAGRVSMDLDPAKLPPFGVYIGELRY